MSRFDYNVPAELFPSRFGKARHPIGYRRFNTAAEAVRFAIEQLPAKVLSGTFIQVDEDRFGHKDIRQLYESTDYPLPRLA